MKTQKPKRVTKPPTIATKAKRVVKKVVKQAKKAAREMLPESSDD